VNDLGTVDKIETGERHDPVAVERGLEREVKAGQGLNDGQPGHPQCRFDSTVLTQAEFFSEKIVARFDAVDFTLLDAAERGVDDLERARHLQADKTVTDVVNARGCAGERHGRPTLASCTPIAW